MVMRSMSMPSRLCLLFLSMTLLVLLSSCSATRLAYSQLDWWIVWRLADFVTLNPEQQSWLEPRLQAHLQWHCRTQLPAYARWLRTLQAETSQPPDPARLEAHSQRLEEFIDTLLAEVAPTVAALLLRLDASQRAELFGHLDEQIAEARAEYLTPPPDKRQRERAERLAERLQPWLGDLTAEQAARIDRWSAALNRQPPGWLENRRRLQAAVRAELTQADGAGDARELTRLLRAPAMVRTEDYQRQLARNRALALALTADLLVLATDGQRRRLQQRLDGLAADFEALSCGGETVATLEPHFNRETPRARRDKRSPRDYSPAPEWRCGAEIGQSVGSGHGGGGRSAGFPPVRVPGKAPPSDPGPPFPRRA